MKEALSVTGTRVVPSLRLRVKLQEAGREMDQSLLPSGCCISEAEGWRQRASGRLASFQELSFCVRLWEGHLDTQQHRGIDSA